MRRWFSIVFAGAALVALASLLVRHQHGANSRPLRVAVLPFENAGPDSVAYLVDGLSEGLINRLTRDAGIALVPWMTASRYKKTDRSLRDLAVELGVQRLITGTVRMEASESSISIAMVDGATGLQDWAEHVEAVSLQSEDLEWDLACRIATQLGARPARAGRQAVAKSAVRSTAARDWYWKGKAAMDVPGQEANASALACFDRAIALDSTFAEAYVARGAALASRVFNAWMKFEPAEAIASFHAALRVDSTSIAAYRGLIHAGFVLGDWEECLRLGRRVKNLGLYDPEALFAQGEAYCLGGLPERAVPIFQEIIAEDPANAGACWFLVFSASKKGDFAACVGAAEIYTRRFGMDPEVELWAAAAHDCLNDTLAARIHYNNVVRLLPPSAVNYHYLGVADFLERTGHHARGTEILRLGIELLTGEDRPSGAVWVGPYYVALHDQNGFRAWVESVWAKGLEKTDWDIVGVIAQGYADLGDANSACETVKRLSETQLRPVHPGEHCRPSRVPAGVQSERCWQEYLARAVQSRERALATY